jgi:hypothetical protein
MKRIKVTGYIYIEDDDYDPGALGPLTETADENLRVILSELDDIDFEYDSEVEVE